MQITRLLFGKRWLGADKKRLGRWGERQAEIFLKRKGLKTLARNFTCKTGELDLVMLDTDGCIVFVEVKTRSDEDFQPAEASLTAGKKKRGLNAARCFLRINHLEERPCRFDLVAVRLGRWGRAEIRHYENAFVPRFTR